MVKQTGPKTSKQLFATAKGVYVKLVVKNLAFDQII
jgi:hypothetical protein